MNNKHCLLLGPLGGVYGVLIPTVTNRLSAPRGKSATHTNTTTTHNDQIKQYVI